MIQSGSGHAFHVARTQGRALSNQRMIQRQQNLTCTITEQDQSKVTEVMHHCDSFSATILIPPLKKCEQLLLDFLLHSYNGPLTSWLNCVPVQQQTLC